MSNNGDVVYKQGDVVELLADFSGVDEAVINKGVRVFVSDDLTTHISFYYAGINHIINKRYISLTNSYIRKEWKNVSIRR